MSRNEKLGGEALPTTLTAERVKGALGRILDVDRPEQTIRESTSLYSAVIRLDSLLLLRLLVSLEEEFDIEIDDEDVMAADLDTVGSLVLLVENALARRDGVEVESDARTA